MNRALLSSDRMNWDEYATADDFQKPFASETADLFRLAFFLTDRVEKAERCLILTMDECSGCLTQHKNILRMPHQRVSATVSHDPHRYL